MVLNTLVYSYDSRVLDFYGVLVDSIEQIVHLPPRATGEGRNALSFGRDRLGVGHDIEYLFEYLTNVSFDPINWARLWRTLVLDRSLQHAAVEPLTLTISLWKQWWCFSSRVSISTTLRKPGSVEAGIKLH